MTRRNDDDYQRSSDGDVATYNRNRMRTLLADAGIVLDEDKPKCAVDSSNAAPVEPINRGEIRRALEARGAPARDLRWLTMSASSLAQAESFTPYRILEAKEPDAEMD